MSGCGSAHLKDFQDETCINWGSTGIGAEVARKAKEQGHEVIAFDITKPSVAVDQFVQVDLSDPTALQMP